MQLNGGGAGFRKSFSVILYFGLALGTVLQTEGLPCH